MSGVAIGLGRLFGLLAAFGVLLQFFLIGRTPWLEGVFGLDKLSQIHHISGLVSFWLILLHPLFLVYGYGAKSETGPFMQFKEFLFSYEHVFLAFLGMLLFVSIVVVSVTIVRKRLPYESWYFIHLAVYLAMFFAFWHQISVGSDILANRIFYVYWLVLYAFILSLHIIFRFARPLYLFRKHRFKVLRLVRENYNTLSVYLTGERLDQFKVRPGQFMIFRFLKKGLWWQAHPFSLSMVPNGKELRITVKELGDFTNNIKNIEAGTSVIIDGPYGIFTENLSLSSKVLFIAGGIGITPIRSLLEQMLKKESDLILLYGNKTERDIVFKNEINALVESSKKIKAVNILSGQEDYQGEKGIIDLNKIKKFVPDMNSRDIFICGPVPMTEGIVKTLQKNGVDSSRIHYERFAL